MRQEIERIREANRLEQNQGIVTKYFGEKDFQELARKIYGEVRGEEAQAAQ